jgi:hypothetical protein
VQDFLVLGIITMQADQHDKDWLERNAIIALIVIIILIA